jgi:hypothetical protein
VLLLSMVLLPQVVSNHIAQLRPYLSCSKASSIRGALMAATGSVLLQVCSCLGVCSEVVAPGYGCVCSASKGWKLSRLCG